MDEDDEIKVRFASNVNRLLDQQNQTWNWLARETGESPARLHGYRHGRKMPNSGVAVRIARALHVSIDLLFSKPRRRRKKNSV